MFLKKEEKIVLQRKNVLENIPVKLQRDKNDIIMFHPFTTNHSCIITISRGVVSKGLERRECSSKHSSLGITLFFCNLAHQATKQMHMSCFGTYKQQLYVYVYFK